MALFKKKNKALAVGAYTEFLDNADAEYMRAFTIKSLNALSSAFSRDCVMKLRAQIYGGAPRYFGTPKFRKTSWDIVTQVENIVSVQKNVAFAKVKVSNALSVNVSEDYSELWKLDISETPVVIDIISLGR